MPRGAFLLFAKEPEPGRVKTRLVPPLTPLQAARLYEAFLDDLLGKLGRFGELDTLLLTDPAPANAPRLGELAARRRVPMRAQQGTDLGARLHHAFAHAAAEGRPFSIAVGGDHPTLPRASLAAMIAHLDPAGTGLDRDARAALLPSDDGGYCAIGLRRPCAETFDAIPWSTPAVLGETLKAFDRKGIAPLLLPAWYDVDTGEDLARLGDEIAGAEPGAADFPHASAGVLRSLPAPGNPLRGPGVPDA